MANFKHDQDLDALPRQFFKLALVVKMDELMLRIE